MFLLSRLSLSKGITSLTSQLGHHVSHSGGASCLPLPSWGITSPTSQLGHHVSHSSAGNHVSHFPAGHHVSHFLAGAWGITSTTSQLGNYIYHFPDGTSRIHVSYVPAGESQLSLYSVGITAPISQWGIAPLTQEHHVSHFTERTSHLSLHNRGTT